ncbi:MAG: hypothetical protein INQ03_22835 [Candidatus Heimdallarchaeota archaeon]|nr:hypothetical protein [Candidatus Heimdallarchaeota archaeon]
MNPYKYNRKERISVYLLVVNIFGLIFNGHAASQGWIELDTSHRYERILIYSFIYLMLQVAYLWSKRPEMPENYSFDDDIVFHYAQPRLETDLLIP